MTQVLIVGAGPAGIRAAQRLTEAGLKPMVVDAAARAGGQIYRRPPVGFTRPAQLLYGSEATKAMTLHSLFDKMVADGRLDYYPSSSVTALGNGMAQVVTPAGVRELRYGRLILATGATDRLAPVAGWQASGCYSLGAAQIALKSQGIALGQQIVLAGSGPLLTLLASQLLQSGAQVAAVLDTAPLRQQLRGAAMMARARPLVFARGVQMRAALGRRYHAGIKLTQIEADGDGPLAIHWQDSKGKARQTPCDMIGLGWHLRADLHLADLAGAQFEWSTTFAQWLPVSDDMGRVGEGLYLAGDGLSILGADGAEIAGRLAATACLLDLGHAVTDPEADLNKLNRMRRFAKGVATAFPWPTQMVRKLLDDTVLCRCENVTAGELRETLDWSGPDANRAKSLGRVGMGRCQGRYCQLSAAEVIAAKAAVAPDEVGRLRLQPPARPVPICAFHPAATIPHEGKP
ncbi:MAG: FAD/NAD(P)-binding oxidoreductase [Sedimentitalea sp.]|uniref:FAD/NAD(P)-binding oxidoreductase n=1 Tax=Sedimentitalea sp. TaxID=2048915 RepID=UPI003264059E